MDMKSPKRRRAPTLPPIGVASDEIRHVAGLANADGSPVRIVLYVRKSNHEGDNLADQRHEALDKLVSPRLHVVAVVECVESSQMWHWRSGLEEAIERARAFDAAVAAFDRSRFLRSEYYDGTNRSDPPTVIDYRRLRRLAGDVTLATILHPDAAPGENRSAQTRRGQRTKSKLGGRPIKGRDRFRRKWLPLARNLRDDGLSYALIAGAIKERLGRSVTHTTIWRWLTRDQK
jgi:DNA invertase Pin-like site-specific DNA recombinase